MPKYANQWRVKINKSEDEYYTRISLAAIQTACQQLQGAELALWLYLAGNKDQEIVDISPVNLQNNWGMSRATYYRARDRLIELEYLTNDEGYWVFRDLPHRLQADDF